MKKGIIIIGIIILFLISIYIAFVCGEIKATNEFGYFDMKNVYSYNDYNKRTTYIEDKDNRLAIIHTFKDSRIWLKRFYEYDTNGNITKVYAECYKANIHAANRLLKDDEGNKTEWQIYKKAPGYVTLTTDRNRDNIDAYKTKDALLDHYKKLQLKHNELNDGNDIVFVNNTEKEHD